MITLRTKKYTLPFKIAREIRDSIKKPLIFYLAHKEDTRIFFITFVIIDFKKEELLYIESYLPENISAVENHPQSNFFKTQSQNANPHCAISIQKDSSFLVFFEVAPFFFQVDYRQNTIEVHTGDILKKNPDEIATSFSPTVFKDDANPNYFYFTATIQDNITRERSLRFYKSSLNLSKIEELYSRPVIGSRTPHVTKKIGSFLVSSNFVQSRFKNLSTGKIFKSANSYALHIYTSLYKEYCKQNKINCTNQIPLSEINTLIKNTSHPYHTYLESKFSLFCKQKGKDLVDICERNAEYSATFLPGAITFLNLETKKEKTSETTLGAPAHFEIDKKSGDLYISSHNFLVLKKMYFWGPAAIDRFRLIDEKFIRVASFSHPTGYRFVSHKIFSYKNKSYLCTFGQPNRLFIADAKTMQLLFYDDIGMDFLSSQTNISHFLNHTELETFVIKAIEVSEDGRFIIFISHDYLYIYDFPKRKIVQKIKYNSDIPSSDDLLLSSSYSITVHMNYLE